MLYAFKLGRKLRGEEPYCAEKGGKGGSSSSGAKEAARATQYAADLQNQQFNRVMEQLAPYAAAGFLSSPADSAAINTGRSEQCSQSVLQLRPV